MSHDPLTVFLAASILVLLGALGTLQAARLVGVFVPVLTALVFRLVYGLQGSYLGGTQPDALGYDEMARDIVAAWNGDAESPALPYGKEGWPYILAILYRVSGYAPSLGIIVNAFAGALTVVVVAAVCEQLGWTEAKVPAAWLVVLWPVLALWGPQLLREAIVALLLALALLGAVILRKGRAALGGGIIILAGVPMIWMRGGLSFLILIGFPVLVSLSLAFSRANTSSALKGFILALSTVAFATFALSDIFADATYFDSQFAEAAAADLDTGGTGFSAAGVARGNWLLNLMNTAIGPLPMYWRSFGLAVAGIDALLWIAMWVLVAYAILKARTNRWGLLLCTGPVIALLLQVSQSATNFGYITRVRGLGLPLLAPVVGLSIAYLIAAKRQKTLQGRLRGVNPLPNAASGALAPAQEEGRRGS